MFRLRPKTMKLTSPGKTQEFLKKYEDTFRIHKNELYSEKPNIHSFCLILK